MKTPRSVATHHDFIDKLGRNIIQWKSEKKLNETRKKKKVYWVS